MGFVASTAVQFSLGLDLDRGSVRIGAAPVAPQRTRPEAFSHSAGEALGQPVDDLVSIPGALLPSLLDLDDLATDHPVGVNHRRHDRRRS